MDGVCRGQQATPNAHPSLSRRAQRPAASSLPRPHTTYRPYRKVALTMLTSAVVSPTTYARSRDNPCLCTRQQRPRYRSGMAKWACKTNWVSFAAPHRQPHRMCQQTTDHSRLTTEPVARGPEGATHIVRQPRPARTIDVTQQWRWGGDGMFGHCTLSSCFAVLVALVQITSADHSRPRSRNTVNNATSISLTAARESGQWRPLPTSTLVRSVLFTPR